MRIVPTRQGVHFPHDSSRMNFMKYHATLTMQSWSSMTTRPPDPIIAPALISSS
jgi:hypothetical protein